MEYLTKYAAKGEPKSPMLTSAFTSVIKSVDECTNPHKAIKKIMMKSLGNRDFSAQETMHLLLSLKLYSTSFNVLPVNLNGSRKVNPHVNNQTVCTTESLLDTYANRMRFVSSHPNIMEMNFLQFATKYKVVKGKLTEHSNNIVVRTFPTYSANSKGKNYAEFCKYQLLKYKPWTDNPYKVCNTDDDNATYISEWHKFLETSYARNNIPNWIDKLQSALHNLTESDDSNNQQDVDVDQDEWMILSDYHNSKTNFSSNVLSNTHDWHSDSCKYSQQQIEEMPYWIKTQKDEQSTSLTTHVEPVDIGSFSNRQRLAYNIVMNHANNDNIKEALLLIINGFAGTGKSYLIKCYPKTSHKQLCCYSNNW